MSKPVEEQIRELKDKLARAARAAVRAQHGALRDAHAVGCRDQGGNVMGSCDADPALITVLKRIRLGRIAATLRERLVLTEKQSMGHEELLLMLLTDEIARREASATESRVRDAEMVALTTVDLLVLDDFALEAMNNEESRDVYQLFLERTGNRTGATGACAQQAAHPPTRQAAMTTAAPARTSIPGPHL